MTPAPTAKKEERKEKQKNVVWLCKLMSLCEQEMKQSMVFNTEINADCACMRRALLKVHSKLFSACPSTQAAEKI